MVTKYIKRAIRRCNRLSNKHKSTFRVIKEYQNFTVLDEDQYQEFYKRFCDSKGYLMELIHTKKYYPTCKTLPQGIVEADKKAREFGGIWHVIKIGRVFFEVHESYFDMHPKAVSLYVSKNYFEFDLKKLINTTNG